MGRSMMCGGVPLLAYFAGLATLINAENEMGWQNEIVGVGDSPDWIRENNNGGALIEVLAGSNTTSTSTTTTRPTTRTTTMTGTRTGTRTRSRSRTRTWSRPTTTTPRPLYENDGFLAGEETPVWIAKFYPETENSDARSNYTRISPDGSTMVKSSIDHWNRIKNRGGFPIRIRRSIHDRGNLTYTEQFHDALRNARIKRVESPSLVEKRSADSSNEVVYPSVLVIMDFQTVAGWSVEDQVLYTLAFWGTVDSSLRNVQNPRVSLRIVGIVITDSREASPYLISNLGENTFPQALPLMIDYWREVSNETNSDFPIGSYDIVAHMTDIDPWSTWSGKESGAKIFFQTNHPILAAASRGPPCQLTDQIGGIIIHDDLAFNGVHRAITQMTKVLGGNADPLWRKGYSRRPWTKEILDSVSNGLKDSSCMSAPKQFHRSGTPVPQILAGELMPSQKQCELAGYEPDAWTCWDTSYIRVKPSDGITVICFSDRSLLRSDCQYLRCSNQHVWGVTCATVAYTLDGSFCNAENTKICLDQKCVDKKLYRSVYKKNRAHVTPRTS